MSQSPHLEPTQRTHLELSILLALSALAVVYSLPLYVSASTTPHVHQAAIRKHEPLYQVNVHYPEIEGVPHSSAINIKIVKLMKARIKEFLTSGRSETIHSSFNGRYKVSITTPEIVSIRFQFENRCPPDGRPLVTVLPFNYCPKGSEIITLGSIFRKSVPYSDLLSVLSLSELVHRGEVVVTESATTENNEDFTLSKTGIDIHFGSEQVVNACTLPEQTVHVPYAAVCDLLSPSSPIYAIALQSHGRNSLPKFTRRNLENKLGALAIAAYSHTINKTQDNAETYRKRGNWYKRLGQHALAETDFKRAAKLDDQQKTATTITEGTNSTEVPADRQPIVVPKKQPASTRPSPISLPLAFSLCLIIALMVTAIFIVIKTMRRK